MKKILVVDDESGVKYMLKLLVIDDNKAVLEMFT